MTEEQAKQKGYRYTGSYERSKEEIKAIAEEYKKEGYKVVICTVPDSPLSRGCVGVGYSIYAEPKLFIDNEINMLNIGLSQIDDRKQLALKLYKKKISEIEADKEKMQLRLKELTTKV